MALPPPNPRDLLPPLLACLPTSFISPQAPPALLPLLTPILRQRISYLSSGGQAGKDGWLSLLSWDNRNASKLPAAVERMVLEPHPVSGEIELDDLKPAKYRRVDEETLQAQLEVEQFDLLPTYIWVDDDEHGGTGPGWKLSDLKTLEDAEDETTWYSSPGEANAAGIATAPAYSNNDTNGTLNGAHGYPTPPSQPQTLQNDDDGDDYWASYDRAPGQTPAPETPAPPAQFTPNARKEPVDPEREYYARYGTEVQPALDSHDPDEDLPGLGDQSTLNGESLGRAEISTKSVSNSSRPNPTINVNHMQGVQQQSISMPRAISPTDSVSSVDHLEEEAAAMSRSHNHNNRAQRGIQQHISTDIKSLFRLARSAGMERTEFERIVQTELQCLDMMEQDD